MTASRLRFLTHAKVYFKSTNHKQFIKEWYYLLQKFPELFLNESVKTTAQSASNISPAPMNNNQSVCVKLDDTDDNIMVKQEIDKSDATTIDLSRSNIGENKEITTSLLEGFRQKLSPTSKMEVNSVEGDEHIPQWRKRTTSVSKAEIVSRTKHLLVLVGSAESVESKIKRLDDFVAHLKRYPEARLTAVKEKAIPQLLRIRRKIVDNSVQRILREAFALLGHVDALPCKGIRILSIDGGGIRGIAVIQMLKKLEELTGKKIYDLFDYICGVSTGSILTSCVGTSEGINLDQALDIYKEFGTKLFTQSTFWGVSNLIWSRAYYDTTMFEQLLKKFVGETSLTRTNRDARCPKMSSISTVMNKNSIVPFVFRNYELPYTRQSQYSGSCDYTMYEAVRASGAAPAMFQEFRLGGAIHQDGGILVNNPCAVAIHEAKLLWPKSEIQCVVSCGTGRSIPSSLTETSASAAGNLDSVSWKTLFDRILDSATDTEAVHTMLNDLLPPKVYFRFNPYLTEYVPMHETRTEKISQLEEDTFMYIRKNEEKFVTAANTLMIPSTLKQKLRDTLNLTLLECDLDAVSCKL